MAHINAQRGPHSTPQSPYLGEVLAPDRVRWTPLQHPSCGCVVDWGWDGFSSPPPFFIQWCRDVVHFACPWHGGQTGRPDLNPPVGATIALRAPAGGIYYARPTPEETAILGIQLSEQLRCLDALLERGTDAVLDAMPALFRAQMVAHGYEPVSAWTEQRFADIVLSQGRESTTIGVLGEPHV
ncbi:hypothetical protein [Streptomyces niveus]|uniref:hypothetical protein n=1 Tax=Streptomyces niveus TaxID=193462 RepID=UPI0036AB2558